ncbi:hypothetical protein Scep_021582 [Stephania cephalantha]|uniref:Uncharacterized protein n=1 Tax=Stephania cephalantha TaxID=152367 RepID=A0AAP0FBJ1_9MAGN
MYRIFFMVGKWYAPPTDSSNYRSAKVPLETFVRIPSTCFDLASEIFIYFYRY